MATINLSATVREGTGKGVARKIRRAGLVPASIYRGGQEPSLITIDPNTLTLAFEKTGDPNTLVNISVGNEEKTYHSIRPSFIAQSSSKFQAQKLF